MLGGCEVDFADVFLAELIIELAQYALFLGYYYQAGGHPVQPVGDANVGVAFLLLQMGVYQ